MPIDEYADATCPYSDLPQAWKRRLLAAERRVSIEQARVDHRQLSVDTGSAAGDPAPRRMPSRPPVPGSAEIHADGLLVGNRAPGVRAGHHLS